MDTLVANFYGGPGAGKSTMCAAVFAELKFSGVNCEMALEWVKEKAWEGVMPSQLEIFNEQRKRIDRLLGKVDVILTDSPIALSHVYGKHLPEAFHQIVRYYWEPLNNLNFYVERDKPYNPAGRFQTFEEARELDKLIYRFLVQDGYSDNLYTVYGDRKSVEKVSSIILGRIDG